MPLRVGLKSAFLAAFSFSATIPAMRTPMAGAEESPGDSMPAALKKPGASCASPRMKSPPASWARRPLKEVITWRKSTEGTLLAASRATVASPSAVVWADSGVSTFIAVGPVRRLPSTVGETKTPLPSLDGTWKTVCFTRLPSDLSKSIYSPALGMMVKKSSPTMRATLSL